MLITHAFQGQLPSHEPLLGASHAPPTLRRATRTSWDDKKINKQKPRFTTIAVDSTSTHRKRQEKQEAGGRMIERAFCMVCTEDELIKWKVEEIDNENDRSIQFGRGMDYGSNKGRWMSHLYQNFLSRLADIWKDFIMAKITEASQSAGLFRQPIGARCCTPIRSLTKAQHSTTLHSGHYG